MSVFEIISKEQFEDSEGGTFANVVDTGRPTEPPSDNNLVWCEFCKDYYNEYHFGDIDEEEGGESQ